MLWYKKTRSNVRPIEDGYDSAVLVDVIVRKTAALTDRTALDAVLPGTLQLPTLLALALAGDCVLDFGGAAGLHHKVAKHAFPHRLFRWAVVDTPLMADHARRFESDELRFFHEIEEARNWLGRVDCIHSIAALQYTPEPDATLARLLTLRAPVVLWAKLELGTSREFVAQRSRLADNGPGPLPPDIADTEVSCSLIRMRHDDFIDAHRGYHVVWHDGSRAFLFAA